MYDDQWALEFCRFGQFILSTLPSPCVSEKELDLEISTTCNSRTPSCESGPGVTGSTAEASISLTSSGNNNNNNGGSGTPASVTAAVSPRTIILRNKCLEILHTLLYNSNKNTIHLGWVSVNRLGDKSFWLKNSTKYECDQMKIHIQLDEYLISNWTYQNSLYIVDSVRRWCEFLVSTGLLCWPVGTCIPARCSLHCACSLLSSAIITSCTSSGKPRLTVAG